MTSPNRSVVVRLALDPASYISGAARAEASTLSLDRAVQRVGPSAATSMEKAAKGAGTAESAMGRLNKTAGALGFTLGGLAGVGALVAGALSVKWAGDYQSALTRLVTTAGESTKNIKMVGQGFLDMAGQVGISADVIAKGAYTAESAGFHGADALLVMKAASEGARQENADLGKVVNATTTILHDYHLKASDAATVTSQLITAVSHGKVSFDELTGALDSITPLAARAGISIADVTGTLAAMTASGMTADQATQNMQNTLLHLAAPTSTMIAELAQLGVSTDDLANSLSTKGLAGTLQMVEEAIVKHLDPATQRVLLPALNASKTAVQDLHVMLGQMPPDLAKLSQGLMDGSVSFKDYRKAVQDLGGPSSAMGKQFLALFESSQGFNSVLKAGGPAAQTFTSAMSKAFGTTSALNVALQTTGENAGATNAAIADIGKASAQADGNIKGWAEVQGNFNQKLAEAEAGMKSLAIEAGQHLLPILTSGLGWVAHTGVPAVEGLGHAVGALPAPVKETALALAALAAANKLGVFDMLASGAGKLTTGLVGTVTSMEKLKATGTGLMNFFGGPVVLGLAGLAAGFLESEHQVDDWAKALEQGGKIAQTALDQISKQEQATLAPSDWLNRAKGLWNDGIAQIQGYSSALDEAQQKAQDHYNSLTPLAKVQEDVTRSQADLNQAIHDYGKDSQEAKFAAWQHQNALDGVRVQESLMDQATRGANAALQDQVGLQQQLSQAGVSLDQAQLSAKQSIRDYQKALKDTNLTEDDRAQALDGVAQSMFSVLDAAKKRADAETQGLPAALVTNQEIVRQRDALDQVVTSLGFVPPALQSMYDQLNGPTAKALQATQTVVGQTGTAMTTVTNDTIPGFNKALGDLATAAGTTVPQSITGGFLPVLKTAQDQLNGPTNQAIQGTTGWFDIYMNHLLNYGTQVVSPFQHAIDITNMALWSVASQSDTTGQHVDLLGQIITGLPNSHGTIITADTKPAEDTIAGFLQRVQANGFVGAVFNLKPVGSGAQSGGLIGLPPIPGHATGGPITGPGSGTSDSVLIAASNGEHMWTASEVAAAGGHAGVEAIRHAVLSGGMGFAGGGPIQFTTAPWQMGYPVDFNSAVKGRMSGYLSQLTSFSGTGAGSPFIKILGQSIAAAMGYGGQFGAIDYIFSHESGWNPNAQNPTSTAFGIPQFLAGTRAQYPGNWSSPAWQITAGIEYMRDRFGSPNAAASFWAAHHWYGNGGVIGEPVAGVGLRSGDSYTFGERGPEVVLPTTREMSGGSIRGGSASGPANVTVLARVFVGDREITDIARIEATAVVDAELSALHDDIHYAGG